MIKFRHFHRNQTWPCTVGKERVVRAPHGNLQLCMDIDYDEESEEKVKVFLSAFREILKESEEFQDGQGEQSAGAQQEAGEGVQEEVPLDVPIHGRTTIRYTEDDLRGEGRGAGPKGK